MQTSVETPRERDKPKKLLDRMRDVMRQLQRALVQVMTPLRVELLTTVRSAMNAANLLRAISPVKLAWRTPGMPLSR